MKHLILVCALLLSGISYTSTASSDWSYTGETGPNRWGALSSDYSVCAQGKNQSPINILDAVSTKLSPLIVRYSTGGKHIINNGHAIQIDMIAGSFVILDQQRYQLQQILFHSPSEHLVNGTTYALEAHLVHSDAQGNPLVIAMLFEEGEAARELNRVWAQVPGTIGSKGPFTMPVVPGKILPNDLSHWRYNGSLTTPPCTEGVRWVVLKQIQSLSKAQVEQYRGFFQSPTNRPVQPRNARLIMESAD